MTTRADCINHKGQFYVACDEVRHFIRELEWADNIRSQPDWNAASGRSMWEIASEAAEAAHDALIDYARFAA